MSDERTVGVVPPQNVEAEEFLLGSILTEEKILVDIIDAIHPDDFYDPRHRILYQGILDLYNKNKPVDLLMARFPSAMRCRSPIFCVIKAS